MEKHGVTIFCEHCQYLSADPGGGFSVSVPVSAGYASGTAVVRCCISAGRHDLELVGWETQQGSAESSESLRREVSQVLQTLAAKRVCGDSRICPAQVAALVEGNRPP